MDSKDETSALEQNGARLFTLPNLLCYLRILLTPVIIYFLSMGAYLESLVIFLCAGLTDALDGALARWLRQTSRFGKFLDPIADKFFVNAVFICFAVLALLPWWFAALVFLRDASFGLAYGLARLKKRQSDVTPVRVSKANTFLQVILGLLVMGDPLTVFNFSHVQWLVVGFVTITSAISAIIYLKRWVVLMKEPLS